MSVKYLWHIYIIDVDNRGKKSGFYGSQGLYYTGITMRGIHKRLNEHLRCKSSSFIGRYFRDARKTPVHVEYLYGTKSEAEKREKQIKRMTRERKKKLIKSENNVLIRYLPLKAIILRSIDNQRQICLRMVK